MFIIISTSKSTLPKEYRSSNLWSLSDDHNNYSSQKSNVYDNAVFTVSCGRTQRKSWKPRISDPLPCTFFSTKIYKETSIKHWTSASNWRDRSPVKIVSVPVALNLTSNAANIHQCARLQILLLFCAYLVSHSCGYRYTCQVALTTEDKLLRSRIQSVPGGMCQTLGGCSLC